MAKTLASRLKPFRDCRIFSIRKVKNQKKWNKEEDLLLVQYTQQYNEKNWKEIASKFYNKNPLQCFSRYKRIKPGIKKGTWKKDEDIKILQLVQKYGKAWSKISREIKTRNGKQIRDRYLNVLDPTINKNKFSYAEDCRIISLYKKHGAKWAVIAKAFPFRTADMIKNRFHSSIKKHIDEFAFKNDDTVDDPNDKTEHELITVSAVFSLGMDGLIKERNDIQHISELSSRISSSDNSLEMQSHHSNEEFNFKEDADMEQHFMPEQANEEQQHDMPFFSSCEMNLFFNSDNYVPNHNNEQDSMNLFSFTNSKTSFEKDYDNLFQPNSSTDDNDIFWHSEEPFTMF